MGLSDVRGVVLHRAYLVHQTNITRMDPTFLVNRLLGGLFVWGCDRRSTPTEVVRGSSLTLIIARETVGTSHADLPTWVWLILRSVAHARHVHQFELVDRLHESDGPAISWILRNTSCAGTTVLGHTIPWRKCDANF